MSMHEKVKKMLETELTSFMKPPEKAAWFFSEMMSIIYRENIEDPEYLIDIREYQQDVIESLGYDAWVEIEKGIREIEEAPESREPIFIVIPNRPKVIRVRQVSVGDQIIVFSSDEKYVFSILFEGSNK